MKKIAALALVAACAQTNLEVSAETVSMDRNLQQEPEDKRTLAEDDENASRVLAEAPGAEKRNLRYFGTLPDFSDPNWMSTLFFRSTQDPNAHVGPGGPF